MAIASIAGARLSRTTSTPTDATNLLAAGWFYLDADTGATVEFFSIQTVIAGDFTGNYVRVRTDTDGHTLKLETGLAGVPTSDVGPVLRIGQWFNLALRKTDTAFELLLSYFDRASDLDVVATITATVPLSPAYLFVNVGPRARAENFKIFTDVLDDDDLRIERDHFIVTLADDLYSAAPLKVKTDLTDDGPNGYDWTLASGTLVGAPGLDLDHQGDWQQLNKTMSVSTASGVPSLTITVPAGVVNGDLLVLALAHLSGAPAVFPGGWTYITSTISGSTRGELYWRRASSEPASYTITGLATAALACMTVKRGVIPDGDPVVAVGQRSNASLVGGDSVTVPFTERGLLVVAEMFGGSKSTSFVQCETEPVLMLVESSVTSATLSLDVTVGVKYAPGPTGEMLQSVDLTSFENVILAAVFAPSTVAPAVGALGGSRYFVGKRSPGRVVTGVPRGDYDAGWNFLLPYYSGVDGGAEGTLGGGLMVDVRDHACGLTSDRPWCFELSKQKVVQGFAGYDEIKARGTDAAWSTHHVDVVTPPLAAQTISGTFNLAIAMFLTPQKAHSYGPTPGAAATVVWHLHIVIQKGDTSEVRAILLDNYLDNTANAFPTDGTTETLGLNATQTLQSGDALAGDRVRISIGYRLDLNPSDRATRMRLHLGTTDAGGLGLPAAVVGDTTNANLSAPYLDFSQLLVELAPAARPSNDTCETAIEISSLPYLGDPFDASYAYGNVDRLATIDNGIQRVSWHTWTADETKRVFAATLGSDFHTRIQVYTGACGALTLLHDSSWGDTEFTDVPSVPAGSPFEEWVSTHAPQSASNGNHIPFDRSYLSWMAEAGVTYRIAVGQPGHSGGTGDSVFTQNTARSSGGVLSFSLTKAEPGTTPETAIVMSPRLPSSLSVPVTRPPHCLERWFKFTAPSDVVAVMILAGGYTQYPPYYQPGLTVFTGSPGTDVVRREEFSFGPRWFHTLGLRKYFWPWVLTTQTPPIKLRPVMMNRPELNQTIYFRVTNAAAVNQLCRLVMTIGTLKEDVPEGSYLVPDDSAGRPAVIVSATGKPLRFVEFAASEKGVANDNGYYLAQGPLDVNDPITDIPLSDQMYLYDPALALQAQLAGVVEVFYGGRVAIHPATLAFYVAYDHSSGDKKISTVTESGVVAPDVWTLAGALVPDYIGAFGVSPDETIFYFANIEYSSVDVGAPVQRYDAIGMAPLSDLAAGVANYGPLTDAVVFPDGSVLIGYYDGIDPASRLPSDASYPNRYFVRRYSPSGAVLQTFDFGDTVVPNRMIRTSDTEFVVWSRGLVDGAYTAIYQKFSIVTGEEVTPRLQKFLWIGGVYDGPVRPPSVYPGGTIRLPAQGLP